MAYASSAITEFKDGNTPSTGTLAQGTLFEAEFDQLYGNWQHFFGVAGTTLTVDNITEKTTDNGILIESILHKDNYIWTTGAADLILGTNSTDYLHITSAGKVGFGTSSPQAWIQLGANGDTDRKTIRIGQNNQNDCDIHFSTDAGDYTIGYDQNVNKFKISASSSLGASDVVIINSSGYVGINYDNPNRQLYVDGNTYGSGYIQSGSYFLSAKGRWPSGSIEEDSTTEEEIFDILHPFIPNTNDEMIISGGLITGSTSAISSIYIFNRALRYDSTIITLKGVVWNGALGPFVAGRTINEDDASVVTDISISW